jgi:periplasmic protein TonB
MAAPKTQKIATDRVPEPDWQVAPPAVSVRVLVCVAVIVPLLLAAGVYWVRHVPEGRSLATNDNVVEVQVIPLREHVPEVRQAVSPAKQIASVTQSEPLVEDPNRSLPKPTTVTPAVTQPTQATNPAAKPTPAASPASAQTPTAQTAAAFQQTLLRHIARFRFYPDQARRDRIQGTVQLVFAMARDGTVSDVWVKTSSGSGILDTAAVETIRKAQPLPPIPIDLPGELNILIPVAFGLP